MSQNPIAQKASSTGMNRLWALLIVVCLGAAVVITIINRKAQAPTEQQRALAAQGWETSFEQAAQRSVAEGKPILVDFTADWCPPCQYMKYQIFTLDRVMQARADRFISLRADITSRSSPGMPMAMQYEIQATPTLLILDAQGRELARQVGALDESSLLKWFESVP